MCAISIFEETSVSHPGIPSTVRTVQYARRAAASKQPSQQRQQVESHEQCQLTTVHLSKVTMNGSYGGSAFDFVDNFNYGGENGDSQDQQQHQHQQLYLQNAAQFESYDPLLVNNPSTLYHHNIAYNSTGPPTHHTFLPQLDSAGSVSLQMSHAHMMQRQHQLQYTPSNHVYVPAPSTSSFLNEFDSLQSLSSPDPLLSSSGLLTFPGLYPDQNDSIDKQADKVSKEDPDLWLEQMRIECSDLSLEKLSGKEVLTRVRAKTDDVVTRYLPCVEFLVKCQQELRAGLIIATQKRMVRHVYRDTLTPKEFYKRYLAHYPNSFYERYSTLMESTALYDAVADINALCQDSKRVEYQGCETMKNTFLGGMKDGESWGLRKWLATHGGALHICNYLECILRSCQGLDRSQESTRKLSERLRPLAQQALDRLKSDVPPSYQEMSTAHPYLPFFHRLESALKGMANFDPEDDDVICIESDDEDAVQLVTKSTKRHPDPLPLQLFSKRKKQRLIIDDDIADLKPAADDYGQDAESSVIEIVDKPSAQGVVDVSAQPLASFPAETSCEDWECPRCTMINAPEAQRCCMCDRSIDGRDCESDDEMANALKAFPEFPFYESGPLWDSMGVKASSRESSVSPLLVQLGCGVDEKVNSNSSAEISELAAGIENIARAADCHQHRSLRPSDVAFEESFWDLGPQYAGALRLLISTMRSQEAVGLLDPVDEAELRMLGLPEFSSIIKHPLCLRDIAQALITNTGDVNSLGNGKLSLKGLSCWNMWRGMDLLQALDLVLLNNLAYNGKNKTRTRSATNRLRRVLWDGINGIVTSFVGDDLEKRREFTPTRRGESSGFVVRK